MNDGAVGFDRGKANGIRTLEEGKNEIEEDEIIPHQVDRRSYKG